MRLAMGALLFVGIVAVVSAEPRATYVIVCGEFTLEGKPLTAPCIAEASYDLSLDAYKWRCDFGNYMVKRTAPIGAGIKNFTHFADGILYFENHTEYGVNHQFVYISGLRFVVLSLFVSSGSLQSRVILFTSPGTKWQMLDGLLRKYDIASRVNHAGFESLVRSVVSKLPRS